MSSVKGKSRVFIPISAQVRLGPDKSLSDPGTRYIASTEQSGSFITRLCRLTDHTFGEIAAKLGT